ncbi:MAG: hypothetical protein JSR75_22190 [Proteobacteria bacterium]|nr:hypothetical protein [Pseudomonadota bacterium]
MPSGLAKTEAGIAEIRERSHALPRHARTLLVLADGTRSADQLLAMVQGATQDDIALLLASGLVAETSRARAAAAAAPVAAPAAAPAAEPAAPEPAKAEEGALSYRELYDSLNALSKEQLGLFKGYKFALEIEKANGLEGLREVAQRLVDEVERVKGESAAQMVRRALGMRR